MSSDDDTFLSAYLDGELDPDQQQRVDSALVSSPDLSERLRALSVVRDLVVGLHRDTGTDITPMVMNRIRLRRQSRSLFFPFRPMASRARQAAAAAGILTVAAGLLLVVTLIAHPQTRRPIVPAGSRAPLDNAIADSIPGEPGATASNDVSIVALQPRSASPSTGAAGSVALHSPRSSVAHNSAAAGGEGQLGPGDLELSRRVLESPYRRRFFLSKSGRDGKAEQQVVSVVERTTQFGFFKITVSQGIVIDPRHPEEATVFALLVNPNDLDRLRDQLKVALPDLVEEPSADPAIVTQLADIGRLEALSPSPLGDVSISREGLAFRTRAGGGTDGAAEAGLAATLKDSVRPTAEQFRSAPLPAPAHSGSPAEPDHGTEVAAADDAPHFPGAPRAAVTVSSSPATGTEVAGVRSDLASPALTMAKSDETILVFVWICKPRAS